jgi:hypothetical protein
MKNSFIPLLAIAVIVACIALHGTMSDEAAAADGNLEYEGEFYALTAPHDWDVQGDDWGNLSFTLDKERLGEMTLKVYDPDLPITQLEDNQREYSDYNELNLGDYPAYYVQAEVESVTIDPYTEQHVYVLLAELGMACDFCFYADSVDNETAVGVASSLQVNTEALQGLND